MADQWYYRLFGEEFGPVPRSAIEELSAKGTLGDDDEVRADGSSLWQSVSRALTTAPVLTSSAVEVATLTEESADDELTWYYQFMGDEMGPVSFNELLEFAHIGQLTADDQIKYGEKGKWRRLGAIGRLVAVLPYQEPSESPTSAPVKKRTESIDISVDDNAVAAEPGRPPVAIAEPVVPPPPRYLPAAEEKSWYAWIRGSEFGPTHLLEINQWLTSGQIGPADFVRYGMMGQWAPPTTAVAALAQLRLPDPVVAPPPQPTAPPMPAVAPPATVAPAPAAKVPEPTPERTAPAAKKTSNPAVETVKEAVKPAASVRRSEPAVDTIKEKPAPIEERKTESRPVMDPPRSTSSYGGGGGSSYGGMSSTPAWQAPAKPAYKPPPRKSSGGSSIDFGAMLAPLKDGKTLGIVGGVAGVGLLVALWMFLPASTGADVAKLKQLEEVLADFRKARDSNGDMASVSAKADKVAKPIIAELKNTANRKAPAKQCLLWAARDALPRMLKDAKAKNNPGEKEFEGHIHSAQRILKVGNPPPPPAAGAAANEPA